MQTRSLTRRGSRRGRYLVVRLVGLAARSGLPAADGRRQAPMFCRSFGDMKNIWRHTPQIFQIQSKFARSNSDTSLLRRKF